jgi:hypothetical protein
MKKILSLSVQFFKILTSLTYSIPSVNLPIVSPGRTVPNAPFEAFEQGFAVLGKTTNVRVHAGTVEDEEFC